MVHPMILRIAVIFLLCAVVSTATLIIGSERYCFDDDVYDPTLRVPMADSASMTVLLPPASRLQLIADNKTKCGYKVIWNGEESNIQIIYIVLTSSSQCHVMGVNKKKDLITAQWCCHRPHCINDKTTYDVYQDFVSMVESKWHGKVNVSAIVKPPLPPSRHLHCRFTKMTEHIVFPDLLHDHRLMIDVSPETVVECRGWIQSCGGQIEMKRPFAKNDTDCDPTDSTTCKRNELWISYRCMETDECEQGKIWVETPSRKRLLEAHFCCHTDDCNHLTVREVYRQYLERQQEEPVRAVPVAEPLPTTTPTEPCGDYVTAAQMIVLLVLLLICLLTLLCVVGIPVIVKAKFRIATELLQRLKRKNKTVTEAANRTTSASTKKGNEGEPKIGGEIHSEQPIVTEMHPLPPSAEVSDGIVTVAPAASHYVGGDKDNLVVQGDDRQPLASQHLETLPPSQRSVARSNGTTPQQPEQKEVTTPGTGTSTSMSADADATDPSPAKEKKQRRDGGGTTASATKNSNTSSGSESTQSNRESQFVATKARDQSTFVKEKP